MKTHRRNLLGLFVVLSLVVHSGAYALLRRTELTKTDVLAKLTAIPLMPAKEALSERQPRPLRVVEKKPRPVPPGPEDAGATRFRPHQEEKEESPRKTSAAEPTPEPAIEPSDKKPRDTALAQEEKPAESAARMTSEEHQAYREELLRDFDPDWTEVPELVVLADAPTQRAVSTFFGMTLIAYPKDEAKPSYVILIDEATGDCQYTRDFDFARYSNRVKDRGNVEAYRALVRRAKSRLALPEDLAIVSLVPADADVYFAAKQMQAVQRACVSPDDVLRTEGHYVRDANGRYMLIIDTVVTTEQKTVEIDDAEGHAVAGGR